MSNATEDTCKTNCKLASVVLGLLVFLLAWRWLEWSFFMSAIIGVVVGVLVCWLVIDRLCKSKGALSSPTANSAASSAAPSASVKADPAPAPVAKTTPTPAPAAPVEAEKPAAKPTAKKPTAKKAASKPAAKTATKKTAAKPAAKKPAAKKAAPKPAADGKPAALKKARGGKADDLKKIKGVGPGLEKTLNENGIFHYDQIATWKKAEIAYADEKMLKFKGRATRDEWVKQAKTLAKGGDTAFSKKVDKGGVY